MEDPISCYSSERPMRKNLKGRWDKNPTDSNKKIIGHRMPYY
jgi:hypothetical protein